MVENPDVSIIVVSWNVGQFIPACLHSISAALGGITGEVFVIDNASSDQSADLAQRQTLPNIPVTVIRNTTNHGFATANNQALRRASGRYVLLLNPDTVLKSGAIATLVRCLEQHRAGICGARHLNPDGTLQPSVRRLPTPAVLIGLMLKLHRLLTALPMFRKYFAHDFDYAKTQPAEQVAGSCLLISRSAYQRIGPLDERYYLWFEEVDWCKRARTAGLPVWYCAEAELMHVGGQSFAQLTTLKRQRAFNGSARYYIKKHFGLWPRLLTTLISPVSLMIAAFTLRHKPPASAR